MTMTKVLLHRIAHARTGDKGNRINVAVFAYEPEFWPLIRDQVTEDRLLDLFRHRGASRAVRYELPLLQALNFVVDDVLQGGVNASLNVDGHGKTHSFRVLGMTVEVPDDLLAKLAGPR